jgi:hypothetical protein
MRIKTIALMIILLSASSVFAGLDAANGKIVNVADCCDPNDATNKKYVDANVNQAVKTTSSPTFAGVYTGDIISIDDALDLSATYYIKLLSSGVHVDGYGILLETTYSPSARDIVLHIAGALGDIKFVTYGQIYCNGQTRIQSLSGLLKGSTGVVGTASASDVNTLLGNTFVNNSVYDPCAVIWNAKQSAIINTTDINIQDINTRDVNVRDINVSGIVRGSLYDGEEHCVATLIDVNFSNSVAADANRVLYTAPSDANFIPTRVLIYNITGSLAGGTAYYLTGRSTVINLASVVTPLTSYWQVAMTGVQFDIIPAGATFQFDVKTGSTLGVTGCMKVYGVLIR